MAQLIVNIAEGEQHDIQVDAAPSVDKYGKLIVTGPGGQIVYNQWRFFLLNNQQQEAPKVEEAKEANE